MRSLAILFLLSGSLFAAVVPDGSVVHSETEAPRLTTDKTNSKRPAPGSSKKPEPAASLTPQPTALTPSSAAAPGAGQAGSAASAFSDREQDDPSSRPQLPLAPIAAPSANTKPLWTAVLIFAMLAGGGVWLAQNRSSD